MGFQRPYSPLDAVGSSHYPVEVNEGPSHTCSFPLGGSLPRANGETESKFLEAPKVGHKLQEQCAREIQLATQRRLRMTRPKMPPEFAQGCKLRDLLPFQTKETKGERRAAAYPKAELDRK